MAIMDRFKNEFAKNVLGLTLTTALSQAIPFLVLPILQRFFYSPEDFGIFSAFISVSSVIIAFATFKYEFAIVLAEKRKEAIHLLLLSLGILSLVCFLILFLGFLFPHFAHNWFQFPQGRFYVLMLVISIMGYGGTQVFNYWQNYQKQYKGIGYSKIIQSFTGESTKVVFGYFQLNAIGLIFGRVIGHLCGFLWLILKIIPSLRAEIKAVWDFEELKAVFKKHRAFMYYSAPSSFLGSFTNNLHILIPMQLYTGSVIGLIGAAYIYLAVPAGVISGSFSQVFYKKIADTKSKSEVLRLYTSFVKQLFLAAIPFAILIQFIPNSFAGWLLGNEWNDILIYSKIMVIYLVISFVSSAVSFIYIRLQCQKKMMFINIFHALLNIGSIYLGHYLYQDPVITIAFFCGSQVVSYLISIMAAIHFIKTSKILT